MRVRYWGVRGSLPTAGPETVRYGGNTSSLEVNVATRHVVALDAGSGMRRFGEHVPEDVERIDILLTHLHMDHIMGLGFFGPLFRPDLEVHLWGPSSTMYDLGARLGRYLNPPLFPVRLPDLPAWVHLHDLPIGVDFPIPGARVRAELICHPGPAVGYRLTSTSGATLAYLPDHEPRLGSPALPDEPAWLSGYDLAEGVDLLVHDAQYTEEQYADRIGWGHTSVQDAVRFAELVGARHLAAFHHDPGHADDQLDRIWDVGTWERAPEVELSVAREGAAVRVGAGAPVG